MRCNVCNTELAPNEEICSNCGSVIPKESPNGDFHLQHHMVDGWSSNQNRTFNPQTGLYEDIQVEMPMKWYKFLIYISLFYGAIRNCYNAIQIFSGNQYIYNGTNQTELVYSYFPSMKVVDIVYGIIIIVLSIFMIITRQKLKEFSKQGPKYIMWLYIATFGISLSYNIIVTILTDVKLSEILTTSVVIAQIISLAMIFANRLYFQRREHLFVN